MYLSFSLLYLYIICDWVYVIDNNGIIFIVIGIVVYAFCLKAETNISYNKANNVAKEVHW